MFVEERSYSVCYTSGTEWYFAEEKGAPERNILFNLVWNPRMTHIIASVIDNPHICYRIEIRFSIFAFQVSIYCDNLHWNDHKCIKTKTVWKWQPPLSLLKIYLAAKFIISLKAKIIRILLPCHIHNVESFAYTLDIIHLNSQYTTSGAVSGIVYAIVCSLVVTWFNAPSSSFFRSPLIFCQHMWSALFEPLTYRNEQKTCQISHLNFYELINLWIYAFLNLSCTLFIFDAMNTYISTIYYDAYMRIIIYIIRYMFQVPMNVTSSRLFNFF